MPAKITILIGILALFRNVSDIIRLFGTRHLNHSHTLLRAGASAVWFFAEFIISVVTPINLGS